MKVIEVKGLSKSYGKQEALKDVSLDVSSGVIFGLLGPNGAGKTTLVKILLDLIRANSGEVSLNEKPSTQESARLNVGYLPEKFNFYPYYTVGATVRFYGEMQGLRGEDLKTECEKALSALNILDMAKQKIKTLSKGQLQRTGLACMLMGDNQLFILDEPFSGLDPIGIKELKNLILELKERGRTIFINSHILSEMEQLCDEIAILNKGQLIEVGKIKDLIGEKSLEDHFYSMVVQ